MISLIAFALSDFSQSFLAAIKLYRVLSCCLSFQHRSFFEVNPASRTKVLLMTAASTEGRAEGV